MPSTSVDLRCGLVIEAKIEKHCHPGVKSQDAIRYILPARQLILSLILLIRLVPLIPNDKISLAPQKVIVVIILIIMTVLFPSQNEKKNKCFGTFVLETVSLFLLFLVL